MSEQPKCHEWSLDSRSWFVDTPAHDGGDWMSRGFCPRCGTRLSVDGTETRMVPAVTPEAVQATLLHEWLARRTDAERDANMGPLSCGRALLVLGLCDKHGVSTDAGRTIVAALSQAADPEAWVPRAALHMLAEDWPELREVGEKLAALVPFPGACCSNCGGENGEDRHGCCWQAWLQDAIPPSLWAGLAALASAGAKPAPEPPAAVADERACNTCHYSGRDGWSPCQSAMGPHTPSDCSNYHAEPATPEQPAAEEATDVD